MKSISPWVVGIVIFFLVIAGVQGFILTKAISGRPAEVIDNPYEAGLKYQAVIDQKDRAIDSGATLSLTVGKPGTNQERLVSVKLTGGQGIGAEGKIRARRADTSDLDEEAQLFEDSAHPNEYQAKMRLARSGLWMFELELPGPNGPMLFSDRLMIP